MRKEFVRIDVRGDWEEPGADIAMRGERIADSRSAKRAFLAIEEASNEPCEIYIVFEDWKGSTIIPSYISASWHVSHILRALGFTNFYKV